MTCNVFSSTLNLTQLQDTVNKTELIIDNMLHVTYYKIRCFHAPLFSRRRKLREESK